eukprot:TRINITY_DN25070_c0_g1_i2.p1 TRINITY_DN25070_c0_g1~~TRINITY_DN25070_c0_g1_i2.p1  ORF type:complete len:333 (-),score=81.54 TRINITY_DN25070_c0_g1_i2:275-1273(-)
MADAAVNLGLTALDVVTGVSSNRLDRESLQLARAELGCAEQELEISKQTLGIDRDALDMARRGLELDQEQLTLAHRMEILEARSLRFNEQSTRYADQSLLAAEADLTRNREWKLVEEKTQQLKAISNLSALIAGFAMVSLVELTVPDDINSGVLMLFGLATALVVCTMLLTMLTTSMMLVYILNYRQVTDQCFKTVWGNKCERDWRWSFNCFKFGVPCFMVSLGCISWIKFQTENEWADIAVSTMVTVVVVISLIIWIVYVKTKYATDPVTTDMEEVLESDRLLTGLIHEREHLAQLRKRVVRLKQSQKEPERQQQGHDSASGFGTPRSDAG